MMDVMNPLSLLTDLLPAQARKYVYAVAAAALFVYGLWEVSAGDVRSFVVSVVSALVATLAAANTPASRPEVEEAAEDLLEDELDDPYEL
jgi:hypothetical protein